jgi:hypothetical protein
VPGAHMFCLQVLQLAVDIEAVAEGGHLGGGGRGSVRGDGAAISSSRLRCVFLTGTESHCLCCLLCNRFFVSGEGVCQRELLDEQGWRVASAGADP